MKLSKKAESTETNMGFIVIKLIIAIPIVIFLIWLIFFGMSLLIDDSQDTQAYSAISQQILTFIDSSQNQNSVRYESRVPIRVGSDTIIRVENQNRLCVETGSRTHCQRFQNMLDSIEIEGGILTDVPTLQNAIVSFEKEDSTQRVRIALQEVS